MVARASKTLESSSEAPSEGSSIVRDQKPAAAHELREMPASFALSWLATPSSATTLVSPPQRSPRPAQSERVQITPRSRLEAMFRAHHALIWRTLRRMGCSPDAAADATQQAYLVAAERLDDIREGSERAFLFRTAVTLSRTKHRREQRCDLEQDMDLRMDSRLGQDPLTRQQYVRQLLDRALARLDEDLVTVFTLFELEGQTSQEIAALLDVPLGTVASRLRRAREAFRREAERLEVLGQGGAS